MGGMDGMMGGGFGMFFGILFWAVIIALIVWAFARLVQGQRGGGRSEERSDSAEETLRGRFARGEIDAEEYERSLAILRGNESRSEDRERR